jgi:hypothetical protein
MPVTAALKTLNNAKGQPKNEALTNTEVDADLRRADQKSDRRSAAGTIFFQPDSGRNDATGTQRKRNSQSDGFQHASGTAETAADKIPRQKNVDQPRDQRAQKNPRRKLDKNQPHLRQ